MGFTTGFIGGATLTTATVYLTLELHTRNRLHQSALLRQQKALLLNVMEPQVPETPATAREHRAGLAERVKERWNAELERGVKGAMAFDWEGARRGAEGYVGAVLGRGVEGARREVEELKR